MFSSLLASFFCLLPLTFDDPTSTRAEPFACATTVGYSFDVAGRRMVAVNWNDELLYWEGGADKPAVIPLLKSQACGAVLCEEGRRAVVFYFHRAPELWDLEKKVMTQELECKRRAFYRPRISPDGKWLTAMSPDRNSSEKSVSPKIHLWSTSDWKLAGVISSAETINDYCFSPDGRRIIAGSAGVVEDDGKPATSAIVFWDVDSQTEVDRIAYGSGFPLAISASPDGRWIAAGGGYTTPAGPNATWLHGQMRVFDASQRKLVSELHTLPQDYVRATAFSADGRILYCGSYSYPPGLNHRVGELKAWSTKDWSLKWTAAIGTDNPHEIAVSPRGKSLLFPARKQLYVVDAASGEVVGQKLRFVDQKAGNP